MYARFGYRPGIGSPIKSRSFSGLSHSAGKLLHTYYRMPTSMATVQLSIWDNAFYMIVIDDWGP